MEHTFLGRSKMIIFLSTFLQRSVLILQLMQNGFQSTLGINYVTYIINL